MFGNNMFGHHLAGQYTNPGFGSSGFGKQQDHSAFGSSKKGQGLGFGQANTYVDQTGMMHHAYDGMHHYGHHGILRQNSLLGEMTQSKAERAKGVKPWAFSSISYPDTADNVLSSMYEKPLEHQKPKPMLSRQQSFSMADSVDRKRAPSFSSDPEKMRSRTFSSSSLPAGRPRVMRSLSIVDDLTEPQNMDIAVPFLRRQQSLDIEKARRKSLPKKPLIPLHLLSKHRRRSSKVKENFDKSEKSETSSLQPSTRSRSSTVNSQLSSKSSTSSTKQSEDSPENEASKPKDSKTPSSNDDEKLILSLLNPVVPDDNVFEPQTTPEESPQQPALLDQIQIESPTMISKRVHQLMTPEPDNASLNSNESGPFTPQEPRSRVSSQSSRKSRSPATSPVVLPIGPMIINAPKRSEPQHLKPVVYTEPADSDNSDVYYDCNNISQRNSPEINQNDTPHNVKTKKRSVKKTRNIHSSSSDGEETTSTCDTPPRSTFRDIKQKYQPETQNKLENEHFPCANDSMPKDIHEADTLKIQDKGFRPILNNGRQKERQGLKRLSNDLFSRKINDSHDVDNGKIPNPESLVIPTYAPVLKAEPGSKETINNETADSSESGYATSYIPTSPKNYDHIKVSQFVNSLPNYSDMDEQRSESSHNNAVLNGSETESDLDEDSKVNYPPADLDLSNVNCESGSDSENESIKTDCSISKLEVMKLLESPTIVKERVTNSIREKSNSKPHTTFEDSEPKLHTVLRKGSNASETELLKPVKPEKEETKDDASEKSVTVKHVEVNSVVVTNDSPKGQSAETKLLDQPEKPSFVSSVIERLSFRREYSSVYQSKSTNCIDAMLHFLNLLLFLSSAGVVGVGIWLQLKDFNVNDITIILGNNLLQVITYVAISGAGVTLLAAMCLCCGIRQDKSGLGFYAFVLVAVVIAFATAAVLSTIFSDKLKGIEFKFNFQDRLVTMYGLEGDVKNKFFTSAWDNMQSEFECCGGDGDGNGTESWALYRKSAWYLEHADKGKVFVPESCCKKNSNIQICQGGDHDLLGPPRYAPPKKLKKYYKELNPNLNPNGCYASFSAYLSTMSMYIATVCGSLAGLYFLTVMLTWVFCFKKSQDYSESFMDDSYYDIEENDEVFNSVESNLVNKEREPKHVTEETKFINTPTKSSLKVPDVIINGNVKLRDTGDRTYESKANNFTNYSDRSMENSDSSESDDETESGQSTPQEVTDRRNMWLSSAATAGHLLSIAIEEEDSNFEDSDVDENQKFSANV